MPRSKHILNNKMNLVTEMNLQILAEVDLESQLMLTLYITHCCTVQLYKHFKMTSSMTKSSSSLKTEFKLLGVDVCWFPCAHHSKNFLLSNDCMGLPNERLWTLIRCLHYTCFTFEVLPLCLWRNTPQECTNSEGCPCLCWYCEVYIILKMAIWILQNDLGIIKIVFCCFGISEILFGIKDFLQFTLCQSLTENFGALGLKEQH